MRVAALVLGILGGIFGLFGSLFALGAGGLGSAFEVEGSEQIMGLALLALLLSTLGIVGGGIAMSKPKAAGIIMLIAGIGGLISINIFYIIAGPILFCGGIIALLSPKPEQKIDNVTTQAT